MAAVISLITLPLLVALFLPFMDKKVRDAVVTVSIVAFASLSLCIAYQDSTFAFKIPDAIKSIFTLVDFILLFFFLWVGVRKHSKAVAWLAFLQLVLFIYLLLILPHTDGRDIIVDQLTLLMYLVINIVGGSIIVYALGYIESEKFTQRRKNSFIALLVAFLGVMNLVVSSNNIEIFFLAFELTTLSSYLLIGYRQNTQSIANSLKALWMNQVGGVAILIALISAVYLHHTIYFDLLILQANDYILLPVVFLVFAAFVKGASFPFHTWLLGAMVAPTPVSAILHSATMVKIAPFLILKLSPAFSPFVSTTVALFGGFVFMVASLMALNRDFFKEILALSTIALLALMTALGALGNEKATTAAMILLFFHAVSKALLFLQAGTLEKIYQAKNISDMNSLMNRAPKTIFFILIGFASLTLPPFGAFIGKFMAFEAIAQTISTAPLHIFLLVLVILGSIVLTLLYFKVASKLLAINIKQVSNQERLPVLYFAPVASLFALLVLSIFGFYHYLGVIESLLALSIILLLLIFSKIDMGKSQTVNEYNCGEIDQFEISIYYFDIKWQSRLLFGSFIFWFVLLVGGLL
jgi:ech hydrogenase subunit A